MNFEVNRILVPLIIALITTSALFIIRGISFKLLHKWAEKTETKLDDIILRHLEYPPFIGALLLDFILVLIFQNFQKYIPHRTIYLREEKDWQK